MDEVQGNDFGFTGLGLVGYSFDDCHSVRTKLVPFTSIGHADCSGDGRCISYREGLRQGRLVARGPVAVDSRELIRVLLSCIIGSFMFGPKLNYVP